MASKKYNFTRTEFTAGLMVIASVAVLAGFVVVIENLRAEPEYKTLYARFTSTVGLNANAMIRFGGLEVGTVASVTYDPEDQSQILLELKVDPKTPVNESSRATIEQTTLTAEKHLEISTGTKDAALVPAGGDVQVINSGYGFIDIPNVDGLVGGSEMLIADLRDFIGVEAAKKGEAEGKGELASIERLAGDVRALLGVREALERHKADGSEPINVAKLTEDLAKLLGVEEAEKEAAAGGDPLPSVTRITGDVRDLLGVKQAKAEAVAGGADPANVENIIGNVDGMLEKYDPQIGTILEKVPPLQDSATRVMTGVATTLEDNKENIDKIATDVSGVTATLNQELEKTIAALTATLEHVQSLSGETEELVHQNRPAIEDLMGDLGHLIQNLNVLLEDLKAHPQAIIFGKPESGRK
ncbi:MAG: MCE family protein [Candidatus Hydrogenedentes bacterium]|nr:MCE family protein [Candidatus Hydrogenedentota bacterium]